MIGCPSARARPTQTTSTLSLSFVHIIIAAGCRCSWSDHTGSLDRTSSNRSTCCSLYARACGCCTQRARRTLDDDDRMRDQYSTHLARFRCWSEPRAELPLTHTKIQAHSRHSLLWKSQARRQESSCLTCLALPGPLRARANASRWLSNSHHQYCCCCCSYTNDRAYASLQPLPYHRASTGVNRPGPSAKHMYDRLASHRHTCTCLFKVRLELRACVIAAIFPLTRACRTNRGSLRRDQVAVRAGSMAWTTAPHRASERSLARSSTPAVYPSRQPPRVCM